MSFAAAEQIADAVLFEGYVLYPYRASAAKNRLRWQFGVLVPRAHGEEHGGAEPSMLQADVLIERGKATQVDLRVRFLHVQSRSVEEAAADGRFRPVMSLRVGERELVTWDEGLPHACDLPNIRIDELLAGECLEVLDVPGSREVEEFHDASGTLCGRVVREQQPLRIAVVASAEPSGDWVRLRVRVANETRSREPRGASRDRLLRESLVGAHTLLAVRDGAFLSLVDPPAAAAGAAARCVNLHTWPALLGSERRRDLVLASPIILPDYPEIAPESPGDLHDGTEIDEILTLRIMSMTDEEKREARATDERARRIIDRSDGLAPEIFARLHGTIRSGATTGGDNGPVGLPETWAFFDPPGTESPEAASIEVAGARLSRGSHVRLRPRRRADSMDMFLRDRNATVAGVHQDVDDRTYVAVTIDDDPGADLQDRTGRYYYFHPDELEPLEEKT